MTPEKQGNLPDLVVASLSANERNPAAGAQFTVAATVANQGDETAAATTLRYYRSPDANITPADTEVGMEAVRRACGCGEQQPLAGGDGAGQPRQVLLRGLRGAGDR